jgi:hypothetical protein
MDSYIGQCVLIKPNCKQYSRAGVHFSTTSEIFLKATGITNSFEAAIHSSIC